MNPQQQPQQVINPLNKPILSSSQPDLKANNNAPLSLIPQASKISPRQAPKASNRLHYTTTYNASYSKP